MRNDLTQFDSLLHPDGPAAIVLKQWLKPVGSDVFFPPTYANPSQKKGDPSIYNIDRFGETATLRKTFEKLKKVQTFMDAERTEHGKEHSVCVVDSIPSQANRIEPAFARIAEGKLVPKVTITVKFKGEEDTDVNLLEAGHRAADAIVRFSEKALRDEFSKAICARGKGDSLPLAKLAPTSLVFGMWDSRNTGVKVPRLINSIIRAYGVLEHRRSAQYFPATDYAEAGVAAEKGEKGLKKLSEEGMAEVPATFVPGGIEARDGICREASLNLATLRDIETVVKKKSAAGKNEIDKNESEAETRKLQRYLLGLSLVAITWYDGKVFNLRQGCQLVADPERPMTRELVNADGKPLPFEIDRDGAVEFAKKSAEAFVVGAPKSGTFDPKAAKEASKKAETEESE